MRNMAKLTEDMVIARTKSSDLGAVKKLNCWGSDLVDVSLVKRLQNVEVLSLSLNKITSLSDFQYCRNLVELYIRRNAIHDLSELCYLQDLPRLRRLLLAENPCVDTAGAAYRATVIRCLPSLEVLDNNEVSPEEVEHAVKSGLILEHPLARRERLTPEPAYYCEDSPPSRAPPMGRRNSTAVEYEEAFRNSSVLSRSPPAEYSASPYIHQTHADERRSPEASNGSGPRPPSATNTNGLTNVSGSNAATNLLIKSTGKTRRDSNNSGGSGSGSGSTNLDEHQHRGPSPPTQFNHPTTTTTNKTNSNSPPATDLPVTRRVQRSPVPVVHDYQNQSQHQQRDRDRDSIEREQCQRDLSNGYQQRRGSTDYVLETARNYQESYYDDSPPPHPRSAPNAQTQSQRFGREPARSKPRSKPQNGTRFMEQTQNPAGPRSSNLLSAALCLIPELDWASLEVVELAIRRRMDELLSD